MWVSTSHYLSTFQFNFWTHILSRLPFSLYADIPLCLRCSLSLPIPPSLSLALSLSVCLSLALSVPTFLPPPFLSPSLCGSWLSQVMLFPVGSCYIAVTPRSTSLGSAGTFKCSSRPHSPPPAPCLRSSLSGSYSDTREPGKNAVAPSRDVTWCSGVGWGSTGITAILQPEDGAKGPVWLGLVGKELPPGKSCEIIATFLYYSYINQMCSSPKEGGIECWKQLFKKSIGWLISWHTLLPAKLYWSWNYSLSMYSV